MTALLLLCGLVLLIAGAELLVRGASVLAARLRISPLVIGLTVVAFGTSAPEFSVSLVSGLSGQPDVALGNVVGSNIFNVLFILGVSALITPMIVAQRVVRFDVPLMLAVSLAVPLVGWDGRIDRPEGLAFFIGLIGYTVWCIVQSRHEEPAVMAEYSREFSPGGGTTAAEDRRAEFSGRQSQERPPQIVDEQKRVAAPASRNPVWIRDVVLVVAGLAMLVFGSKWLVAGAVELARRLGVSELVVGLTIVSAGTSLPEVATSVLAAFRGERDIAVGNVVGSNIFNILGVLGLSAALAPAGVDVSPAVLSFDIPLMIVVAAACFPVFFTGNMIARWEGGLFLGYYVAYVVFLVLQATAHPVLPVFTILMSGFVVPLTAVTLTVVTLRTIAGRRKIHNQDPPQSTAR